MDAPRSDYVPCAGREIHVSVWNPEGERTVVLSHGLARTGRDFDALARALAADYRVLAPDQLGRGLSQWAGKEEDYCLDVYAQIAVELCAHYDVDTVRWVGTSMGGALGIKLAAGPLAGRVTHLVVNDIGPELPGPAVERILSYVGSPPSFATVRALEDWLREVYAPFGALSDAEWRHMAETSLRRNPDGTLTTHYDPRIARQFVHHPSDFEQWDAWDRVTCPTLLYRGADTDLLPEDWASAMTERGPRAEMISVAGCGHAPPLNTPGQIEPIAAFLRR